MNKEIRIGDLVLEKGDFDLQLLRKVADVRSEKSVVVLDSPVGRYPIDAERVTKVYREVQI